MVLNGKGTAYNVITKDFYEGEFKNNAFNGKGTVTYGEKSQYVKYFGDFVNGVRNGEGDLSFKSGATYNGGFFNDTFHGTGRFYNPTRGTYKGHFEHSKRDGEF